MTKFNKLTPFLQSEIVKGLLLEELTYEQIQQQYGVEPQDLHQYVKSKAIQPYNEQYRTENENQEAVHKKTVFGWVKWCLVVSAVLYVAIVLIQSFLGGFESQIVSDSIAFVTQPFSKGMNLGIAMAFIVLALYLFFPILATFINEKVNTVSLKDTFIAAKPESKLSFLGIIILSLCLLTGLVFSAKAQTSPQLRECIISTAYKEVGVIEQGGNNKGKRIDEYRSVSLGKTIRGYSDAWCGYFVSFVYKTCQVPHSVRFSPRARDWFDDPKRIVWRKNFQYGVIKPKPQKGDLIGYKFTAGNIGHIEILYEWGEDYFISIGGNTSASGSLLRDANTGSDGVRLKKRKTSTAFVVANHIDTL